MKVQITKKKKKKLIYVYYIRKSVYTKKRSVFNLCVWVYEMFGKGNGNKSAVTERLVRFMKFHMMKVEI